MHYDKMRDSNTHNGILTDHYELAHCTEVLVAIYGGQWRAEGEGGKGDSPGRLSDLFIKMVIESKISIKRQLWIGRRGSMKLR